MQRIDLLKSFKILTDDALMKLNKIEMCYENGTIDQRENFASRIIADLYEYRMTSLEYGPLRLPSLKDDILLKVGAG